MQRPKKYLIGGGIAAIVLAGPAACGGVILFIALGSSSSSAAANPCSSQTGMVNPGDITITGGKISIDGVKLDKVQQGHAALIAKIGQLRGFSRYSIAIAIATAYQESELKNVDYGDRDSLGLFQQRTSQGWGTPSQIMNPVYATNKFYDALAKVKDRDTNPSMMEVAIEVQRPSRTAYESRWRWDTLGKTLAAMYAAETPAQPIDYTAGCQLTGEGTITAAGWTSPLRGNFVITSPFNPNRLHPITGIRKPHTGVDIGAPGGTPVHAAQTGTVLVAKVQGGYGNYVVIQHAGNVKTAYAHLSGYAPGIQKGVNVQPGQLIGYVGTTGSSTGNHLHLETILGGNFVDPVGFFKKVGINL